MKITRGLFIKRSIQIVLAFIVVDILGLEKFFFETKEFFLGKAGDESKAIKLMQLSDLHLRSVGYLQRQIAKRMNTVKPDMILITGDAIDKAENLGLLRNFLDLIDPELPKVAILGNWEYWGLVDIAALRDLYAKYNCDLLINDSRQYVIQNKRLSITGIDDLVGGQANYVAALQNYKTGDYHIVLTHCPEHRDILARQRANEPIDLVLSGHTHGGQITILGFAPFKPRGSGKYLKGWYEQSEPKLYVSKGIGTSVLPFRFGAKGEVAVFNIRV